MVDAPHAQDIAFMISIWPNTNRKTEDNAELLEAGGLLSNLNTYDAFSESAREFYWRQIERELYPAGVDGWWCDSTEPSTSNWSGETKRPDDERYALAKDGMCACLDARHANSFALNHAKGIFTRKSCQLPVGRYT